MMSLEMLLRRSPLFAALDDDELARLAGAFRVGEHRAGHVFIREGEAGDDVYLVMAGEVVVLRRGTEINRLRPGALFGLMALVDRGPRAATCRADDVCRVAHLPRERAEQLLHDSAKAALAFQRAVAKQLANDFRALNAVIRKHVGETGAAVMKRS
jgi:CRP/FNR family transcriptional regulator